MLMLLLFYTAFCSKLFRICLSGTISYTDWTSTYFVLDIGHFYVQSSASQIAQRWSVRLVIHGLSVRIPEKTILPLQYYLEWILFPPKTAHFVPMKRIEQNIIFISKLEYIHNSMFDLFVCYGQGLRGCKNTDNRRWHFTINSTFDSLDQ